MSTRVDGAADRGVLVDGPRHNGHMKERALLMSDPEVQTILDDSRTQFRRVMRPQPDHYPDRNLWAWKQWGKASAPTWGPYGTPGDRLWVRETWRDNRGRAVVYRANGTCGERPYGGRWKPSTQMPRKHSRLTLEVTDVRVERIQDISEADAVAEGAKTGESVPALINGKLGTATFFDPRYAFASAWDAVMARKGFPMQDNPWVWVVTFRRA